MISELIAYNSINILFANSSFDTKNLASAIPFFIWPISSSRPNAYEIKLKSNYDLISKETAKSIFVHNIYADYISEIPNKNASWHVDLNTEPCVFLHYL